MHNGLRAAIAAALVGAAVPASALTIDLVNVGGVKPGTDAYNGFSAAAAFWESMISTDVTVKIAVGYDTLPPNVLGQSSSTTNVVYTDTVVAATEANKSTALDKMSKLPTLTESSAYNGRGAVNGLITAPKSTGKGVNTAPLTRIYDDDGSVNNSTLNVNTALMKALGLKPTYDAANTSKVDATIRFSSSFAFDFNPINGITSKTLDFMAIAMHEIGHALGFRSGVDAYDTNTSYNGDLNDRTMLTPFDLWRYSANPQGKGVDGPVLDWGIGGTAKNGYLPYFSVDGGETVYNGNAYFSTGVNNGDGWQASHWIDKTGSATIGLMDPSFSYGTAGFLTNLDLAAFDVMGWDINYDLLNSGAFKISSALAYTLYKTGANIVDGSLFGDNGEMAMVSGVPEPTSWVLMIAGFGMIGFASRRRSSIASA